MINTLKQFVRRKHSKINKSLVVGIFFLQILFPTTIDTLMILTLAGSIWMSGDDDV